ncbi:hypothetical protein B0T25DRAFT_583554 [Lasiosphaeria hispida]|uniref:MYND-type domain-containing protein n=1 Tax=Lasiosphaeria hispida TaxID=260671 RepID=A0AAJ0HB89_9PEZI|nr:hypothetical protein B0T25DRAFT_583554 [Lasiosphaeria hispida]
MALYVQLSDAELDQGEAGRNKLRICHVFAPIGDESSSCLMCDQASTTCCDDCKEAKYCSGECLLKDARTHKPFCDEYVKFREIPRPSANHRRVLVFHARKKLATPEWAEMRDDGSLALEIGEINGYFSIMTEAEDSNPEEIYLRTAVVNGSAPARLRHLGHGIFGCFPTNNSAKTSLKTPPLWANQSIAALSSPGHMFQWPGPVVFFPFGYDLRDYIKVDPEYVGKKRRGAERKMERADIQAELHELQVKLMADQLPDWQLNKLQVRTGDENKTPAADETGEKVPIVEGILGTMTVDQDERRDTESDGGPSLSRPEDEIASSMEKVTLDDKTDNQAKTSPTSYQEINKLVVKDCQENPDLTLDELIAQGEALYDKVVSSGNDKHSTYIPVMKALVDELETTMANREGADAKLTIAQQPVELELKEMRQQAGDASDVEVPPLVWKFKAKETGTSMKILDATIRDYRCIVDYLQMHPSNPCVPDPDRLSKKCMAVTKVTALDLPASILIRQEINGSDAAGRVFTVSGKTKDPRSGNKLEALGLEVAHVRWPSPYVFPDVWKLDGYSPMAVAYAVGLMWHAYSSHVVSPPFRHLSAALAHKETRLARLLAPIRVNRNTRKPLVGQRPAIFGNIVVGHAYGISIHPLHVAALNAYMELKPVATWSRKGFEVFWTLYSQQVKHLMDIGKIPQLEAGDAPHPYHVQDALLQGEDAEESCWVQAHGMDGDGKPTEILAVLDGMDPEYRRDFLTWAVYQE